MRIIPYILYLFLLAFHLTIFKQITSAYGGLIDLSVIMIALVALYRSETTTLWFAVCAAVIAGSPRLDMMPWELLMLVIPALVVNQISVRINLESITSRLIIVGGFLLVHQAFSALIISARDFFYLMYSSVLPTLIYSMIVAWIIFLFIDGRITWKKIKALF